jgi:hypothetical protein
MKWSIIFLFFAQSFSLDMAHAADKSKYELAVVALDAHDCKTALPLLKEYKNENGVNLEKHKDFEEKLNKQIEACAINFEEWERTHLEAYQPSEIRFGLF